MSERASERNDLAAINAEEKQTEELILHHDGRIISALRKGEEISPLRKKRRSGYAAF